MRPGLTMTLCAAVVLAGLPSAPGARASAAPPAPPGHTIVVTGAGITSASTWPAFDPAVGRFAVSTTSATAGSLTVDASTTDPSGVVRIDGRVAPGGHLAVAGLVPGAEVNVQITDAAGTSNQSFVYLPPGFPRMTATSSGSGPAPGSVFLTTTSFFDLQKFETVVDAHGVPTYVSLQVNPMDLKRQPNGHYSVARGLTANLDSSFEIVELDQAFRPVATYTTRAPLLNTEFHDSVLEPGGGRILMAYEHAAAPSSDIDSVIQEVRADGTLGLTWSTADHTQPSDRLTNLQDYAHMNSIEVMKDGNLMLSFRHLSQVMKVDRQTGQVLWRLGGRRSDFTFPNDPWGGPCAQHTARELTNGDIQVWDNGSQVTSTTFQPMCPDPGDPTGPRVERPFSRVVTYHLDEATHVATMVAQYRPYGGQSFTEFAGSAQRLGAGTEADHVLLGMADAHDRSTGAELADVLEVDAAGQVVWSLDIPGVFSYRAQKFAAPDVQAPTVTLTGPTDGATYAFGSTVPVVGLSCTDRGGSNLDGCAASVADGSPPPTTVGQHTLVATASDRAGNTAQATITYTVAAPPTTGPPPPPPVDPSAQPDLQIRSAGGRWYGAHLIGGARHQTVTVRLGSRQPSRSRRLDVRVRNRGQRADRILVTGSAGTRAFGVRYFRGSQDLTARVRQGWLTPRLAPGQALDLRMVVSRTDAADVGARRLVRVVATAHHSPDAVDRAAARLKAP